MSEGGINMGAENNFKNFGGGEVFHIDGWEGWDLYTQTSLLISRGSSHKLTVLTVVSRHKSHNLTYHFMTTNKYRIFFINELHYLQNRGKTKNNLQLTDYVHEVVVFCLVLRLSEYH